MNKYEAEKIINNYGAAISKGTDGDIVRRISWLPCSKARIKQAYFVYIEALITEHGGLPEKIGTSLTITYSMLNSFLDEETADELIKIEKLIKEDILDENKPKDKEIIDKYINCALKQIRDDNLFDEINEFIADRHKAHGTKINK